MIDYIVGVITKDVAKMEWILSKLGVHSRAEAAAFIVQFLKFAVVGVSNTAVSLGIYYLVLWIDPALYLVGSILGSVLGIANAFYWNDKFVFAGNQQDIKSVLKRIGKMYVGYGGTALLGIVLLWVEVNLIHIGKVIAPVVKLIVTIPLNFLINKLWTFQKKEN